MSEEDKQNSINIFWFFTAILTLIFVFGTSIALMNFSAMFMQWNGTLGDIVTNWHLNISEPFENLLVPFTEWMGMRSDWLSHYLVFGILFYTLMLCVSQLLSKWDKADWRSLTITWPIGVVAWPGMITLLLNSTSDRSLRKYIILVASPFLIYIMMLIVNVWA